MSVVSLIDGPESRIVQIIEQGRGITGSVGSNGNTFTTHAQAIAIAVDTFRRIEGKVPLDDPGIDGQAFDRAYHIEWIDGDDEGDENEYDNTGLETLRVEIQVGLLFGKALANNLKSANGETSAVLQRPKARGIAVGKQITRALTFGELYQQKDIDPAIILAEREGRTTVRTIDGGRAIASTVFRLTLELDLSKQYG